LRKLTTDDTKCLLQLGGHCDEARESTDQHTEHVTEDRDLAQHSGESSRAEGEERTGQWGEDTGDQESGDGFEGGVQSVADGGAELRGERLEWDHGLGDGHDGRGDFGEDAAEGAGADA
jgi:hypothetical protein